MTEFNEVAAAVLRKTRLGEPCGGYEGEVFLSITKPVVEFLGAVGAEYRLVFSDLTQARLAVEKALDSRKNPEPVTCPLCEFEQDGKRTFCRKCGSHLRWSQPRVFP